MSPTEATHSVTGGMTAEALNASRIEAESIREMADVAGLVNAGHGRMVDLTVLVLAEGHHVGPGLHTPAQYLRWRFGIGHTASNALVRVASRVDELPCAVAALRAGEISLDQAAVIAKHAPTTYDRSATELARSATVEQLTTVVRAYRDPKDGGDQKPAPKLGVAIKRDDHGGQIRGRLSHDGVDLFEQALNAAREDLFRQRERDARAAAAPGQDPAPFDAPTSAEALTAVSESLLRQGEAVHPGAERYLVTYHLHTTPDGRLALTDDSGRPLPEHERRRVLCDHAGEAVFHGRDGTPLSVGRKTRTISRKLRRAILFRHHRRCAVPGCDSTHGLEIHHIIHWEDGGPTDTGNLLPLCRHHHRAHHQGLLLIEGDADLPAGAPGAVVCATPARQPLPQGPTPRPIDGPEARRTLARLRRELRVRAKRRHIRRPADGPVASTPTGERMTRFVHLQPAAPAPSPPLRR